MALKVEDNITEIKEEKIKAYPNPFNTVCSFGIPKGTTILEIFDIYGVKIAEISYPFVWQPDAAISSGVYYVRAENSNGTMNAMVIYSK